MKLKPITEVGGPVTQLEQIADVLGVDALVRAIAGGLQVYDAGSVLLADLAEVQILVEARVSGTRAIANEAP